MDLRNLSSTPNQIDSVMQRRPSLSSLSSTSGYASSSYGGNQGNANTNASANGNGNNTNSSSGGGNTPQLTNQRLTSTSRNNLALQNSWLNHQTSSNTGGLSLPATNVGPWVEQQQQQQQSTLNNMDNKVIESRLQKDKAPSIPNTSQAPSNSSIDGDAKDTDDALDNDNDIDEDNDDDEDDEDDDDDELIPTAIVIKNIPFAIKKEQLLDVMTKLNLPLPYAFNYHFDNGVFRGLAFANFTSTDETSMVVNQLNGREIGGRKLRVEYKKMLPLQERERIEREKREKRGQLEEQHRSNSNASLASLLSAASTTAATKNLSITGTNPASTTERFFVTFPFNSSPPSVPIDSNFNDPETLELYTQLVLYRDDVTKSIFELAVTPANLSIAQRKVLSSLCQFLNLLELFDNGLIIIRRKPGHIPHLVSQQQSLISQGSQQPISSSQNQTPSQNQTQSQNPLQQLPSHSSSMLNLNQLGNQLGQIGTQTHPELLRSQSQSALPLPRLRQQASTPIQQNFPQYQPNGQGQQPGHSQKQHLPPQQSRPYGQQYNMYQQQHHQPLSHHQQHPHQHQHQLPQGQQPGHSPQILNGLSSTSQVVTPTMGSSAASLLRSSNNRSYVDIRSTPPLNSSYQNQAPLQQSSATSSPTPQHHHSHSHGHGAHPAQHFFQPSTTNSQPQTPMANSDISSRFQPFGQHAHLTGSFTSLQQNAPVPGSHLEEFGTNSTSVSNAPGGNDRLSSKFNTLNLSNNGFDSSNSGIWGPK